MSLQSEIIDLILTKKIQTKEELHREKIRLCKKYNVRKTPQDSEILACLPAEFSEDERQTLHHVLQKKPMRTISGVAIVAVMTSPEACPHGRCLPCPGGPNANTPQSYTGYEPAAMRAIFHNFDPFHQTKSRLEQLRIIGHAIDKIDLIIMGGTFTARPFNYQQWFIKRCYDALNKQDSPTLYQAQKRNETASSRCIGLTVETSPDWFRLQHADNSLSFGATRVELGVQTIYDDILYKMHRGHTVSDTISATQIAKECGFKVCYHMMPGLFGSTQQKDLAAFRTIFRDQRFKPDMIKIYPTLTIQETELYDLWKSKQYTALTTEQATRLIAKIKTYVPEWVRIQRIQRDVPVPKIVSGLDKGNLRQLIKQEMNAHQKTCRCIRCREVGHRSLQESLELHDNTIKFYIRKYCASSGIELFLSIEDKTQDIILGYLRLRDSTHPHRWELQKEPCMIIREVRVLGRELSLGKKTTLDVQHKGYGKQLIQEAERICIEEFDKKKLFVLSGIGVKEYYRKLGFVDEGVYLVKHIR